MTTKTAHYIDSDARHDAATAASRRQREKAELARRNAAIDALEHMFQEYGPEWITQRVSDLCTFSADACVSSDRANKLRTVASVLGGAAVSARLTLGKH